MLKIKNINKTNDSPCKCGSWLKHWEKFSGEATTVCACVTCAKTDLVGCHVQLVNNDDDVWYIVPLCNFHSRFEIELPVSAKFVSAHKTETCEK